MPRNRHDTSSDDSDSSEEDVRRDKMSQRSQQGTERRGQHSASASPQKKSKGNQNARKRMDSGRESSPDSAANRSRDRQQYSSDSDSSPVKRSVVSKVERANAPAGRGRDNRDSDSRSRVNRDDRRDQRGPNVGQRSNRREESPARLGRRNDRNNEMPGRLSPDRRQRRNSLSPDRQRSDNRLPRRQDRQNRSLSRERNDMRNNRNDSRRRSLSPDRNARRFDAGRNDSQGRGMRSRSPARGQRSPARGQGWRDQPVRDRFENEGRGPSFRNDQRSRSFDRQNESRVPNKGKDRVVPDRNRQNRGRSPSPVRSRTRNDSDVSFERRDVSPQAVRLNKSQRGQRSVSPARSNRGEKPQRSVSPVRSNKDERLQRSVSPVRSNRGNRQDKSGSLERKKNTTPITPIKSKSKRTGETETKASRSKDKSVESSNVDSEEEIDRISDISKKGKGKKKKKASSEKDDSLERSFERSKKLLEESSHSNDLDIAEPKESALEISPVKGQKRSKRQREYSESELELLPKKNKKSKGGLETGKTFGKKAQKKSKKNVSTSWSPSPNKRTSDKNRSKSSDKNRSRSSERSFGRNHDMAQFESEPESGEITDSEEEGDQARQALKSLINKPTAEEEQQNIEDERYLNQKRKASRMKQREESEKKEPVKDRGSKRKAEETKDPEPTTEPATATKKPKPADGGVAALTGRTGGAYIPPARLRAMQAKITDKSSVEYQRISWEALKKSINGLVNKVNVGNIEHIVRELFQENIVRGRGMMARSIIQAQAASPTFTHVYAALVSIVNTKFPQNGELILRRIVIQFRRGYKRNDKNLCLSSTRFIAHLVNQQVAHEVLALEVLTLLLETPTDDSVEVSIGFLKECGQKLTEVTPRGINAIFERLRNILHEGQIDIRVQYMMEVMFAVRKDGFKDFPAIVEDLDLVEEEDQFTHLLTLEDAANGEDILNVFKADPDFEENEEKYKILKKEILGESGSDDEDGSGSGSSSGSDGDEGSDEEDEEAKQKIIDQTETNMVALRRAIYLTIQSSLDFEECAHKLMKMELKPGQEVELCSMILDCCAQMRTYEKFFGLLAGRFCMIDRKYVAPFLVMFKEQYETIHRLETNKLRNIAKFFAHLLHTDSITWAVLQAIKLNEDDTTSASRIFIKILFQELSEYLGLPKLNERLKDPTLQEYYAGLLPRDNPRDTRFAINFFTTIGLGGLTDDLRDHLKDVSKKLMQQKQEEQAQAMQAEKSDDSSDDSSDESDATEDSESSSSASDSESSDDNRKKKKKNDRKTKTTKEKDKKVKDKGRNDREKVRDKDSRKDRDKTNGTLEKSGRNVVEKVSKKDKKRKGKTEEKIRKEKKTEEEIRREQEEQFKKLAKLANYGNIDELAQGFEKDRGRDVDDRRKSKKDRKDKKTKEKKDRQSNRDTENVDFDDGNVEKVRFRDHRAKKPIELDEFDARAYADKSFESSYDGRDGRGSGRDDERGSGNRRRRDDRGPAKEDRGGYDDRNHGKEEGGRREKGRNKKGRDFIEDDLDDKNVRIERNFERLDLYEEKFEQEREKNLEHLRGREEFQDYYRAREGEDVPRGGPYRDRERELPYKGGRARDAEDRFEYDDRGLDRGPDEDRRRGRNRSEERVPVSGRNERHRRR